jgi:hypothetical protein
MDRLFPSSCAPIQKDSATARAIFSPQTHPIRSPSPAAKYLLAAGSPAAVIPTLSLLNYLHDPRLAIPYPPSVRHKSVYTELRRTPDPPTVPAHLVPHRILHPYHLLTHRVHLVPSPHVTETVWHSSPALPRIFSAYNYVLPLSVFASSPRAGRNETNTKAERRKAKLTLVACAGGEGESEEAGEMKLNIKTLKGTTFEIEAAAEASVRTPPLLAPLSFRTSRFNMGGSVRFRGGWPRGAWRLCCRAGLDLNLGFRGCSPRGGWVVGVVYCLVWSSESESG